MEPLNTPISMDIAITSRCNLNCKFCSHFESKGDVKCDLSTNEWISFFQELKTYPVFTVSLQGAEPLMRDDIYTIIEGIVENNMRFSLLTNGTKINKTIAKHIAATKRCDLIQISIDGPSPEIHDSIRGKGNFDRSVDGFNLLTKYFIPVTSRVTIQKQNYQHLSETVTFLLENLNLPSISINSATCLGRCRENCEGIQLNVKEYADAMKTMLNLSKIYKDRINSEAGPLADAITWKKMIKACDNANRLNSHCGTLSACNGIFSKMAVRSDGVMIPCIQMPHIELGRINEDRLDDVWQNHPELLRLRNRQSVRLDSFEFCSGCGFIEGCTGNCPAVAYTMVGTDAHPSPDGCLRLFIKNGGILPNDN